MSPKGEQRQMVFSSLDYRVEHAASKTDGVQARRLRSQGKYMKTIGLVGGISWQSTVTYYQVINRRTNELLGGSHSAKVLSYSVDFDEVAAV